MEPADKSQEKLTISILDCAKLLGIGRSAAYEAVRRGQIPSLKIGGRRLVPRVALEKLLAEAGTAGESIGNK